MIKPDNKRDSALRIESDTYSNSDIATHQDNEIVEPIMDHAKPANNSIQSNEKDRSIAAKRLLSSPYTVSLEQLNQDIEQDFYDR